MGSMDRRCLSIPASFQPAFPFPSIVSLLSRPSSVVVFTVVVGVGSVMVGMFTVGFTNARRRRTDVVRIRHSHVCDLVVV